MYQLVENVRILNKFMIVYKKASQDRNNPFTKMATNNPLTTETVKSAINGITNGYKMLALLNDCINRYHTKMENDTEKQKVLLPYVMCKLGYGTSCRNLIFCGMDAGLNFMKELIGNTQTHIYAKDLMELMDRINTIIDQATKYPDGMNV